MLKRTALFLFVALAAPTSLLPGPRTTAGVNAPAAAPAPRFAFPDARDAPPAGWTGPVFRMSQDYPTTSPTPETFPWKSISFKTRPNEYLRAVLDYALEGNVGVDFVLQDNPVRKWYHVPWMHPAREFIHGMTRERSSRPRELAPTQTSFWQNWAVGMYNAPGGFVIGRVWADDNTPDPSLAVFPEGTVSFKLLFTQAPVSQVPYLKNSFEWLADINRVKTGGAPPVSLRLLQIDVAVRDSRANDTTGWVFGTFVYDGDAPGATPWERMIPVGLMWGNDPSKVISGGTLTQTKINAGLNVPQHLGFKGRLNGPVDNPRSSCLSCHSTAAVSLNPPRPTIPGVPPANPSNAVLRSYFRNIRAAAPFTPGYTSVDYSLQLQVGIANLVQAGRFQPAGPSPAGPPGAAASTSAARRRAVIVPLERDGTPPGDDAPTPRPRRRGRRNR